MPAAWYKIDAPFIQELRSIVGSDRVYWREEEATSGACADYDSDRGLFASGHADAACQPRTAEDVQKVVELCSRCNVVMVPRGAGTGLEGACVPHFGGLVIDTMDLKFFEVRKSDFSVVCGPGWLKDDLNKELAKHDLIFGVDPSSNPSIGGMASTGSSGLATMKYGTMKENLVSLKVVVAGGAVLNTRSKVRKSSAGYDLTQLVGGSEGTLGVIVELTLRVFPKPTARSGAVVAFPSIRTASEAVVALRSAALGTLVRCELLNSMMIDATNQKFDQQLPLKDTLFIELQGRDGEQIQRDLAHVERIVHENAASNWRSAEGEALDDLWQARRGCYFASLAYYKAKVYFTDGCVPMDQLPRCMAETDEDFEAKGIKMMVCCHIADGNFHVQLPYKDGDGLAVAEQLESRLIDRVLSLGGTVSGEHGVGVNKKKKIIKEHGSKTIDMMRSIKRALDPKMLMNPGKVFDVEASDFEKQHSNL
eukprot:TRINITY_DN107000_c0_g1_i1.p1 TRINITY_DN107000_c0_g1~~TRINITY_DN107000_c0_g1_i1.p1  ORF type:complete len:491 (+),score=103.62 TRINITY_DN107000_c0_g1_i1:39-1475(+)